MAGSVREILERADEVEVIAEKNGTKITTIADATAMANAEFIEPKPKTGLRTYNPDGSLASIRSDVAAINPDNYFANRFKKTTKKIWVVLDYRAIVEQNTGQIYKKNLPVYVLKREEDGKLVIDHVTTVSDTDFVSDYTNTLSEKAMMEVLPVIAEYGMDVPASDMPI